MRRPTRHRTVTWGACLLLGMSLWCAEPGAAQVTFEGCVNLQGIPVASINNPALANVAVAMQTPAGPVIQYNPTVLSYFAAITRVFWYAHECAHHALGHTLGNVPLSRERDADCWAVRSMRERGLLNRWALRTIQRDISRLPGDGWIYLPGPARALNLAACLSTGPEAPAASDICQTPTFWCPMAQAGPVGRSCWCPSRWGPVSGRIVPRE